MFTVLRLYESFVNTLFIDEACALTI